MKKFPFTKNICRKDFTQHWLEDNRTLCHPWLFFLTDKIEHKWPELGNSIFESFFLDSVHSFYSVAPPRLKSSTGLHTPDLKSNLTEINFLDKFSEFSYFHETFQLLCKNFHMQNWIFPLKRPQYKNTGLYKLKSWNYFS